MFTHNPSAQTHQNHHNLQSTARNCSILSRRDHWQPWRARTKMTTETRYDVGPARHRILHHCDPKNITFPIGNVNPGLINHDCLIGGLPPMPMKIGTPLLQCYTSRFWILAENETGPQHLGSYLTSGWSHHSCYLVLESRIWSLAGSWRKKKHQPFIHNEILAYTCINHDEN